MDERNDTRRSLAAAEAELQHIKTDISKLLERQEKVTNKISQLTKTLVIHRILPIEIIGFIFSILCAETLSIPYKRHTTPSQITVSHVCSKWREIALATPALWNDVEIVRPGINRWVQVAQLLLNRAGRRGVTLALDMHLEDVGQMEIILYDILLPLHVKKLRLACTSPNDLEYLLQHSDDIIATIDEIALDIDSSSDLIAPQFFSKIRSLICSDDFIVSQNLPWAQMRYLDVCGANFPLSTYSNILRQTPLLEFCKLPVSAYDEVENVVGPSVLPQLRGLHILLCYENPWCSLDTFLQSFECPNLTDLSLDIPYWTPRTYNLIQNHFNLHRLLKLNLTGYLFPIGKILHDAPALQELIITRNFIFMDESAIHAISSGKLGRCLTSLGLRGDFDVRGVLDMIVARQRCVKQIVEAGRGWRDQISSIKRFFISNEDEKKFKEQVNELKKLGIEVHHHLW